MWRCPCLHYCIFVFAFAGCSAVDSPPPVPSQSRRSSSCGLPGIKQREGCTPGGHDVDDDENSLMQSRVKLEGEVKSKESSWSETELPFQPVIAQLAASSPISPATSSANSAVDTNAKASLTTLSVGTHSEAPKGIPLPDLEEDGSQLKGHTGAVSDKKDIAGKSILAPPHQEAGNVALDGVSPVLTNKVALAQTLQQSQSADAGVSGLVAGRLGTSTGSGDFVWTPLFIFVGFLWLAAAFIGCCLLRSPKEPQREETQREDSLIEDNCVITRKVRNSVVLSQTILAVRGGVESRPPGPQLMPTEPPARWPVSKVPISAGRGTPQPPSSYAGQPRQAMQPRQGPADASALQSLVSLPGSASSIASDPGTNTGSFGTSMQQGIPLCCALIIPDGSRR